MAWITPVTDRADGSARMEYGDMNRITGNIAYLYDKCVEQGITIAGSRISKTEWTQNDIITVAFWTELLTCLTNARNAVGYTPAENPSDAMRYDNINNVEAISYAVYEILAAYDRLANMNHYVGDKLADGGYLRAGDDFNAGGRYD